MKQFILGLATATLITTAIGADFPPFKATSVTISPYSITQVTDWREEGGFWLMGQGSDKKVYWWDSVEAQWRLYKTLPIVIPTASSTQATSTATTTQ